MPKINQLFTICALLVAVSLVAPPTLAQTATGNLRGTVTGQGDEPLAKVKVMIESTKPPVIRIEDETDERGRFSQMGLRPSDYVITVEKDGERQRKVVRIQTDTVSQNFYLDIASATAPVTFLEVLAQFRQKDQVEELRELFAQGVEANAAKNYQEAVTNFNAVLTIAADCYDCYYYLGLVYSASSRDADAVTAFTQAASLKPEFAAPHRRLVNVYNRQRKFDEAGQAFTAAAQIAGELGTNSRQLFERGMGFWTDSKVVEAKVYFEQTISQDSRHADAHYHLGLTNLSQGNSPGAVSALERYLELDRNGDYADSARAMLEVIKQ